MKNGNPKPKKQKKSSDPLPGLLVDDETGQWYLGNLIVCRRSKSITSAHGEDYTIQHDMEGVDTDGLRPATNEEQHRLLDWLQYLHGMADMALKVHEAQRFIEVIHRNYVKE